jgi:hypothetical protein
MTGHFQRTTIGKRTTKSLKRKKIGATAFLERCMKSNPGLFVHWREGMKGAFA